MHCGVPIKAGDQGIVVEATKQFSSSDEPTLAPLHRDCYGPWMDGSSVALRDELSRLRARPEDVGAVDGISAQDRGHGNAVLTGSAKRLDFNYFGAAAEILERLRGLPDDSGPEAIRSEFGRGH
jgi:hypothetical protein